MCLAIFKPPAAVLDEQVLRQGWIANSDGGGFAFVRDKKVQVQKGFNQLKDFLAAYEAAVKANKKSPFLVHFRIQSQGSKEMCNTHPFPFKYGAAIHNGTINGTGAVYGRGDSDTALFIKQFGDKMSRENLIANKKSIEDAIGNYNKMAFLFHDKSHLILNEDSGAWSDGSWFSNSYFKRRIY